MFRLRGIETYANMYEMKMPARYADMTENEMEYDGGWLNFVVGAVATVAGLACTAISHSGIIKDENINNVVRAAGYISAGVGILSLSCGLAAAATSIAFTTAQGAMLVCDLTVTPISILSFLR